MSFTLGLVSVSFRGLGADEIIKITRDASLSAIEWGGDVHVPSGDLDKAEKVRTATEKAGLSVPEYGSYYRLGVSLSSDIVGVARTAEALGTDTVRVWAYNKGSRDVSEDEYSAVVSDAKRICRLYPEITFCTECHNNTSVSNVSKLYHISTFLSTNARWNLRNEPLRSAYFTFLLTQLFQNNVCST